MNSLRCYYSTVYIKTPVEMKKNFVFIKNLIKYFDGMPIV